MPSNFCGRDWRRRIARSIRVVAVLLCLQLAAFGSQVAPAVLQWVRIKQHMAERLSRVSNLTCLETIDRIRLGRKGKLEHSDTVRLEVAFIDGKEMYSWPAQDSFGASDFFDVPGLGTMSSGAFLSTARAVFIGRAAIVDFVGAEEAGGRKLLRYDYRIPLLNSGYRINISGQRARVGYSGSFWADTNTLDVVSLTSEADIPGSMSSSLLLEVIVFGRVSIGERTFLLPQRTDEVIQYRSGEIYSNRKEFSHWREYAGNTQTVFSLGSLADPPAQIEHELPPGLKLETGLATPIDSRTARVGDPIQGKLLSDVVRKKKILVPAEAVMKGRIRWLEKRRDGWLFGIEFSEVTWEGRRTRFLARLSRVGGAGGVVTRHVPHRRSSGVKSELPFPSASGYGGVFSRLLAIDNYDFREIPGVALLVVNASSFRLPTGLHLSWRTQKLQAR